MKRIFSLVLSTLAAAPFGCAMTSDTIVADSAEPVTTEEVREACVDYCRRVAACDDRIDETLCRGECSNIAAHAESEQCEAPLYAALECVDRHFCEFGYPVAADPQIDATRTPCNMKIAAVSCVVPAPPELEAAFDFFGTGVGLSAFITSGGRWNDFENDSCGAIGGQSRYFDGSFEIDCSKSGDTYACSCRIDDRVTQTFEMAAACTINDLREREDLYRACGWHF